MQGHRPMLALTSQDYFLTASRNANDLGLCNGHVALKQALTKGMDKSPFMACAVTRRRFPVGANPTRRTRSSRKQSEQSWR